MSRRKGNSPAGPTRTSRTIKQTDFESIARAYLRNLQRAYGRAVATGQGTPELSFRPELNEFLRNVSSLIHSDIESIFEPRRQAKSGRPDWRFYNTQTLGLYGYIEAKAFDTRTGIRTAAFTTQIRKYLNLGAKVIVTDGIDFIFYSPSVGNKKLSLLRKPLTGADWSELMPDPRVEAQFRDFFESTVSQPTSEESLVKELAKRAIEMSKGVRELAGLRVGQGTSAAENSTIGALCELYTILKDHHDPSLNTPKVFGDFVAQVLAFGLLYAHRVIGTERDTPSERREKIVRFWANSSYAAFTKQLRPFRAIIRLLATELNSSGPLGTWYQDCLMFLSHVRLESYQRTAPDYHVLYQSFLDAFDPNTKFEFGTYFTPVELSSFTVRLTKALVHSELDGSDLYDVRNKLIDPCCGTGTFLEQLIRFAPTTDLPDIIGFEILPAPYALTHYRLSNLSLTEHPRSNISVVLTNTLSDELERKVKVKPESNLLSYEQNEARRLAQPPLMLVIGNPPSSDSYEHANGDYFRIINTLIDDFRPPHSQRTARQNIQKQLTNPFVKFIRWACEKLAHRYPGLFALVLPSSFVSHVSYRFARKWIASRFPNLWVMDLDADLRRGIEASTLFNAQQGRSLVVGITDGTNRSNRRTKLHYATMTSLSRAEKLKELTLERTAKEMLDLFEPFDIDESTYNFKPARSVQNQFYKHFWPLYGPANTVRTEKFIFKRVCSGIKLAPSSLFVHVDEGLLLRRSRDVGDPTQTIDTVLGKWFSGQTKPPRPTKMTTTVRGAIRHDSMVAKSLHRYSYRPFLNPYVMLSTQALASLAAIKNSGTRARPEVVAAFKDKTTIGISIAPAPEDISDALRRFVSFCWYFPDNDLCSRGNAKIFCNQFPEYPGKGKWDPTPLSNVNDVIVSKVMEMTNTTRQQAIDAVVYYVYAVMCSTEYLAEFADALFKTADADNPPRIPITQDAKLFEAIFRNGQALADLEKPQENSCLSRSFVDLRRLFTGPFQLTSFVIESEVGTIDLLQHSELKLRLTGIPSSILDYEVGGYKVLRQWLKLYTHSYLRADFTETHYQHLLTLLSQIEGQIAIIKDLDRLISLLLNGKTEIFSAELN